MNGVEFSRPFAVDRIGATGAAQTITADEAERVALAQRFGLVAIGALGASVLLRREAGLIRVSGRLEADVVQTCVVTLAAFPTHVEDSFSANFSENAEQPAGEVTLDPDYEPPEPIVDSAIDIGELVAQYLALALDPHPRAPGAAIESIWPGEDAGPRSPFAALETLKARTPG